MRGSDAAVAAAVVAVAAGRADRYAVMMRRKERALVIIQRASAIAAVAVFVLWVASVWWAVYWVPSRGYIVTLGDGSLSVVYSLTRSQWYAASEFGGEGPGFGFPKSSFAFQWWFYRWNNDTDWAVVVPLWVFEVPTLALAAALWRRDTTAARRVKAGQCAACGYDRSGIAPEHPCPECGAATPSR
jgi:hypothetical protein